MTETYRSGGMARRMDPHPLSIADDDVKLFEHEGHLYRGMKGEREAFFRGLLDRGVLQRLVEKGWLVGTDVSAAGIEGYPLCFQHRRIPFVSFPYEWGPEMLRDAALLTLDLAEDLAGEGLSLHDAHGWNVVWDGCSPKFVDVGSIVPQNGEGWRPKREFCSQFLYPLRFAEAGHGRLARWLLHDGRDAVLPAEADLLRRFPPPPARLRRLFGRAKGKAQAALRNLGAADDGEAGIARRASLAKKDIARLRKAVVKVRLKSKTTEWSDYYGPSSSAVDEDSDWTPKQKTVRDALAALAPKTLLDIGANRGWYSILAAQRGADVVAFDTDETCIDNLYRDAKRLSLPIQPLVMSFTHPSVGYGIGHALAPPAAERLRCELVLALALVHHLVFKYYLSFERIADNLAVFSERALLVEFVPADDRYVKEWLRPSHGWYTLENFLKALKPHYRTVRVLPSSPAPRVILQCER